jgi:hypothetical protein
LGCTSQSGVSETTITPAPKPYITKSFTPKKTPDIVVPTISRILVSTPTLSKHPCPPEQPPKITLGENYIGLQVPPNLDGLEYYDSLSIGPKLGASHVFDGQNHFFLLSELICIDSDGHAHNKVIDEIKIPPLQDDEFVFVGMCKHAEFDNHIIAIGVFHDDWSITATRAWKVENEIFDKLTQQQVDGLECFDEHPDWHIYK